MIYKWYWIFNRDVFLATGLVSKTYTVILDDQPGQKDFLVTQGETIGITFEGIFVALELNGKNPFEFDDRAIYVDANQDVWFGFAVPSEN